MKMYFLRAASIAALLTGTAGAAMAPTAAQAADKVGKAVGVPLTEAQKAMAAQDWNGALTAAKAAQAVPDQNPYETYEINKFLSIIEINTKDYANATISAEAAADSPAMPDEEKKDMDHNALLLAVQAKHYQKAVAYAQALEQINAMDDATYAAEAESYYYLNDIPNAQKYAQKSIDAAKAAGKQPNQGAMEIIMSSQAKSNNQGAAVATLEQLAVNYNDPADWGQLVDVNLGGKGIHNLDALYMFRVKYMAGAMKSEDFTLMASLASQMHFDKEAATVLEQGVNSGKVSPGQATGLGTARTEAAKDERALASIAAAVAHSKSGQDEVNLAEDYWGYGRYADAEAAARAGVAKGGLKDATEGNMILGISQIAQGKYDEGQATLALVHGSDARNKAAHLWSLYAQGKAKQAAGGTLKKP